MQEGKSHGEGGTLLKKASRRVTQQNKRTKYRLPKSPIVYPEEIEINLLEFSKFHVAHAEAEQYQRVVKLDDITDEYHNELVNTSDTFVDDCFGFIALTENITLNKDQT
ncbi:Hypothetical predicted protein [Octopus vulgaris]|uniref:Uncharacterized protein n=1 Tax=Octopus vulgaris TaxID=6645 RepID=A0AA36AIH4_OCTVU|nr:Hypothetical predicted protein [Octopus vulgaris]